MSLFRSSSGFEKYLEQATSHLLLEPDWTAIMNICDCIRQGDVQAKQAVNAIKKKLYAQNPHVALSSFQVLESIVKNCGSPVHAEVVSRQFMEELRELIKTTPHETVKSKILELIQTWAHAFRQEPNYRAVQDTLNLMKMEGYKFPVLKESDAMFAADTAPDWAEGECCHRCRFQFSVVNRKHHCRNCGQIFCNKCSSKNSAIPKFGIEKEVRVCEACWDKLNSSAVPASTFPKTASSSSGSEQSSPFNSQAIANSATPTPSSKSVQELQEEEDLQLALALSKSEAENKDKQKGTNLRSTVKSSPANNEIENNRKENASSAMDTELARYLNRSYWEQKKEDNSTAPASALNQSNRISPVPSAPATLSPASSNINNKIKSSNVYSPIKGLETNQSLINDPEDMTEFNANLKSTIEIFVNRMKSNYSRGRPIANDTYVQSLFMNVSNMHSQLMMHIQKQDDARVYFEGLQDKLAQARDARAALDALREEHRERLRREAEEAERQRQIQMAQKLDIMRKKKQEYLQYQRQVALQRMQEQAREMQLRQEQHKYHMAMSQEGVGNNSQPPQPPGSMGYQQIAGPPGMQPYMRGVPPMGNPPQYQMVQSQAPPQQQYPGQQFQPQPPPTQQHPPLTSPPGTMGQMPPGSQPIYQGYMQGISGPIPQQGQIQNVEGVPTVGMVMQNPGMGPMFPPPHTSTVQGINQQPPIPKPEQPAEAIFGSRVMFPDLSAKWNWPPWKSIP